MRKIIKIGLATRTISTQPVTYRCEWCGDEKTEERFPGPRPRYCSDQCKREAQNALEAARMRRRREQKPKT